MVRHYFLKLALVSGLSSLLVVILTGRAIGLIAGLLILIGFGPTGVALAIRQRRGIKESD
jgi:hypothetical protein